MEVMELVFRAERYGWTYNGDTERKMWGLMNAIIRSESEFLTLEKAKWIRECLKNIYLDIEPLIEVNGRCGLPWSVKLNLNDADSQKLYLGGKVMVKLPVDKLKEMLSLRMPGVASINIPQYTRGRCFEFSFYKDLVGKLESIINDYDSYLRSATKEADRIARSRLYRDKRDKIENIIDSTYSVMKNNINVPDVKLVFTNNKSDQINFEDFYYDVNQNELHVSYNLDLVTNGSNEYRKLVKDGLSDIFLKIPAFVLTDDAVSVDVRYWLSIDSIVKLAKRTSTGLIVKRKQEYSRKSELTMITYPDGKPFINDGKFTLFMIGFIPYKLRDLIAGIISNISAFDTDERREYSSGVDSNDVSFAPYGKFSTRTRRVKPAYEDLDEYDKEEYINIDEVIEKYYSFSDLLEEE